MCKEAINKYAGDDSEKIRIFAAGFVSGQAEKVYLGACRAAMFRPSQDRYGMLNVVTEDSRDWHHQRALLCGIPNEEVDYEFHIRAGHGERCD